MLRHWILLALPAFVSAQTPTNFPCQAEDQVRAAIREAGDVPSDKDGRRRPYEEVRAERQQRFRALVEKHPDNFWVQRAYLDSTKTPAAPADVIAAYKKRFDADPSDAFNAYLYAHALTATDTPQAIEILTGLTTRVPQFAQPWLGLAQIYGFPNFNDRARMTSYAEAYLERCADTSEAAYLATRLDKSDKLTAFTKNLRERIAGRKDESFISLYRPLWTLEFKLAPIPEHGELRSRVARDLEFLPG